VFRLFERLVADGKTILMVTHDLSLAQRTGRVIVMLDGRIVGESDGTTVERSPLTDLAGGHHE
jgi:ABC-type lipoprotein export system ATPase subunit